MGCVSATGLAEEGSYKVHVLRSGDEGDEVWALRLDFLQNSSSAASS